MQLLQRRRYCKVSDAILNESQIDCLLYTFYFAVDSFLRNAMSGAGVSEGLRDAAKLYADIAYFVQ